MFFTTKEYIIHLGKNIEIYDIHTLNLIHIFEYNMGDIFYSQIYQDKYIITKTQIFNIETKDLKKIKIPDISYGSYGSAIWNQYYILSETGHVRLFDIEKEEITKVYKTGTELTRYCIGVLNNYCISGFNRFLEILNLSDGSIENIKNRSIVYNIDTNEKLNQIVIGNHDGSIEIIDFETKNIIYSIQNIKSPIRYVYYFDNTICYSGRISSYLYFYHDKSFQSFERSKFARFTGNGDLVYYDQNQIKILRIPRPVTHLKRLIHVNLYDFHFFFK